MSSSEGPDAATPDERGVGGFPRPGEQFGRYRIQRRLGHGAMGVVYAATQEGLGRTVALKVLAPDLADAEEYQHRFTREAEALARVDSPHIVQIFEAGGVDDWQYLVMQYVAGGDLRQLIARGPVPLQDALKIVVDVASGLEDAHSVGVLHRDVKPSNILLRPLSKSGYHAYVADLGIAQAVGADVTRTLGVIGSPAYMAPERHDGKDATIQGDVYSLGCVLYAALAGRAPYEGTDVKVAMAHLSQPVPRLETNADRSPAVTARLNDVLTTALAKDPMRRYQRIGELGEALAVVGSSPHPDTGIGRDEPAPGQAAESESTVVRREPQSRDKQSPPQPAARISVRPPATHKPAIARTVVVPAEKPAAIPAGPEYRRRRRTRPIVIGLVGLLLLAAGGIAVSLAGSHHSGVAPASASTQGTASARPTPVPPVAPGRVIASVASGYRSIVLRLQPATSTYTKLQWRNVGGFWTDTGTFLTVRNVAEATRKCVEVRAVNQYQGGPITRACGRSEGQEVEFFRGTRCHHKGYDPCYNYVTRVSGFKPDSRVDVALVWSNGSPGCEKGCASWLDIDGVGRDRESLWYGSAGPGAVFLKVDGKRYPFTAGATD